MIDNLQKNHSNVWSEVKVESIITLEYGKGLPEKERIVGEYPVLGSNGVIGYHNQALVKGKGIVVGRKGSIGAVSWIDSDFWPIDTTYYVQVKQDDIDLKWLFYSLIKLNLPRLSLSDVIPGLKRELVYTLKLHLPPLPEQQKIAEILSTVDEAIEHTDQAIVGTQRLKKGLMQELLTKGIGNKKFKDTTIGRIPQDWEVIKMSDVVTRDKNAIKRGPWGGSIKKEIFIPEGYKIYEQKNVINNDFYKGNYFISKEKFDELKDFAIKENDILLTAAGTIGKVVTVPKHFQPGIINQALIKISLDENLMVIKFFEYLFNYNVFQKRILGSSHGATMKNFSSVKVLKSMKLPYPKPEEQKRIADILSTVDKRLEFQRDKRGKLEKIKRGLMNDLLAGKKRVKLE